ncbi:MAG: hypothetical protein ACRCST_01080 [Turicibacter sp.]
MAGLIVLAILVTIFIGTYVLNNRTPVPIKLEEDLKCQSCSNHACSHKTRLKEVTE